MTELIQSQLKIIWIMAYCGFTAGLIIDVFKLFIRLYIKRSKVLRTAVLLLCCGVIAFLIGDFSFYCQNGKNTVLGVVVFLAGLWLWRRFFYNVIFAGEQDEQKREKTQGI